MDSLHIQIEITILVQSRLLGSKEQIDLSWIPRWIDQSTSIQKFAPGL